MSKGNVNTNEQLKENLKIICNKIETVLSEFKDIKENNVVNKTQQIYYNDPNSKINIINKLKQKIGSLQNSLDNLYDINKINKIESEIKKKISCIKKMSEEQSLLCGLIKNQKKDIDDYSSKFKENKEISEMRNKLNFAKEENHLKKESYTVLNAKVKGQMSKIDILEKQMNIIKQNIEYQKNKQKKEVEKSLNNEENENEDINNDNLEYLINTEKMLISEICEEEKNFQDEIYRQNDLIDNIKYNINRLNDYKNQMKEKKKIEEKTKKKIEEKAKKIKLLKYRSKEKIIKRNIEKNYHTNGQSLDYKTKINKTNKFNYKYGDSPKNSSEFNNNIHIKLIKKPFNAIKFNEIYKNVIGQNFNKKNQNTNIYTSFYSKDLENNKKENENMNNKQKHKNIIYDDIEKLRIEIKNTLKNNAVYFNTPINDDKRVIKSNLGQNNEHSYKNSNKPFDKFNFN